jgi:pimeloyl-ACP methyl ester carboxylesterase
MVSPSAIGTPGPGRAVFEAYDGTREAMRRLVRSIFYSDRWANDEVYVERKHVEGTRPGHWEAVTASRLAMPGRVSPPRRNPPWANCVAPAMFVNGDSDTVLIEKDGGMDNVRGIRSAEFHVVPKSGHCTQIEHPDIFHRLVLNFLDPAGKR